MSGNPASGPGPGEQPYRQIFDAVGDGLIVVDSESLRIVEANTAAAVMHGYSREEFIGLHLSAYIHADSWAHFNEAAHAVQAGGVFESSAIHVRRDGSPFRVEVRRTAFTYRDRDCLLSVVRDVSKRLAAEQALLHQAEARQREQAALLDISHTLASTLELKPDLILDQLRSIVAYSRAALFVLEDSSLVAVSLRGVQQPEDGTPLRIQLDGPETLAQLFNQHRPMRITDVSSAHKNAQFLRALLERGAPALLEEARAWLWVPVAAKTRILGGIAAAHSEPGYFSKHHADLALTVANQAAITMANAELYENARSLAVLEERQRLARNLHDAVNQSLFSAGIIAEVLPRLWEKDQAEARRSLEDLRRLTRGAMAEMRALLAELRPSALTDAELGDLLHLLGNAFTGRTNIPADVTVAGKGELPANVQVAVYRICQEALNNAAKHAGATRVKIALEQTDRSIDLHLRDDGRGFDPERSETGHYGLDMMNERAEAAGMQLSISSRPGHGTALHLRWQQAGTKEVE